MENNIARIPKKRNCIKEKEFEVLAGSTKQIHVPIEQEEYETILHDHKKFRKRLNEIIQKHPEIFPQGIEEGYTWHEMCKESKKLPGIRCRRIKLKSSGLVYMIRPFFILPYMRGYTEKVEKAMFLRRYGVPYSALSYVFGKNDMYWYELEKSFGRNSIVETTIRFPEKLPQHLLADEKHSRENGERIFIPMTISGDCVLGSSVIPKDASDLDFKDAYSYFKQEAQNVFPDYKPISVNTDGYPATRWSWKQLFSSIYLVLCFLHSFLKVKDCSKSIKNVFSEIRQRIWQAYHSEDEESFRNEIQELQQWAQQNIPSGKALNAIIRLCKRVDEFAISFKINSQCYRTSFHLDRIFDLFDRFLYSCKYFHGHRTSSEYSVRAWALLHNFLPYSPRSDISKTFLSPAHRINGFVYHENWLKNLLISSSLGGFRQ